MKSLLFIGFLLAGISYGQTNVIAAKSHANFDQLTTTDPDNFGEFILPRTIQQVTFLHSDCIVEKYVSEWNNNDIELDTICQHPFLQSSSFDLDRLKAMYPEGTEFIGFEKAGKTEKKSLKKAHRKRENNSWALIFFLLGIGGCLLYLFLPNMYKTNV